jgi:hypothetical protein
MRPDEIKVGRVYAEFDPMSIDGYLNDRQVKWMSSDRLFVQCDGPGFSSDRHYPNIPIEKFAAWAHKDVTDILDSVWIPIYVIVVLIAVLLLIGFLPQVGWWHRV